MQIIPQLIWNYQKKHKIEQSRGFLGRLLGPLLKIGSPIVNFLKQSAKNVLIPLGLTAAALATDAAIHKKMFRSGCPSDIAPRNTILITSNEEINDIMKIVKLIEEFDLLIKVVSQTIKS